MRGWVLGISALIHAGCILLILDQRIVPAATRIAAEPLAIGFVSDVAPVTVPVEVPRPAASTRRTEDVRPAARNNQPAARQAESPVRPSPTQTVAESTMSASSDKPTTSSTSPVAEAPASASRSGDASESASRSASSAASSAVAAPAGSVRQGVSIDASYAASNPVPPYPSVARRLGEQGTVVLRILVGSDGQAKDIQIKRSSGSSTLDRSAETTIKQWRFNPAKIDGKPVEEWYETRWTFRLEG